MLSWPLINCKSGPSVCSSDVIDAVNGLVLSVFNFCLIYICLRSSCSNLNTLWWKAQLVGCAVCILTLLVVHGQVRQIVCQIVCCFIVSLSVIMTYNGSYFLIRMLCWRRCWVWGSCSILICDILLAESRNTNHESRITNHESQSGITLQPPRMTTEDWRLKTEDWRMTNDEWRMTSHMQSFSPLRSVKFDEVENHT